MRPLSLAAHEQDPCPAHIRNQRWDILGWNEADANLFSDWGSLPVAERNSALNYFNNSQMRRLVVNWEAGARETVAHLRMDYARSQDDPAFAELIQRLQQDETFAQWWPQYEVLQDNTEPQEIYHPLVGTLMLDRLIVTVRQDPLLILRALLPIAGTDGKEKLRILMKRWISD